MQVWEQVADMSAKLDKLRKDLSKSLKGGKGLQPSVQQALAINYGIVAGGTQMAITFNYPVQHVILTKQQGMDMIAAIRRTIDEMGLING